MVASPATPLTATTSPTASHSITVFHEGTMIPSLRSQVIRTPVSIPVEASVAFWPPQPALFGEDIEITDATVTNVFTVMRVTARCCGILDRLIERTVCYLKTRVEGPSRGAVAMTRRTGPTRATASTGNTRSGRRASPGKIPLNRV